jgi:hypothetical protein
MNSKRRVFTGIPGHEIEDLKLSNILIQYRASDPLPDTQLDQVKDKKT